MKFYANENFPLPAVKALRRMGHDVLTTAESGRAGLGMTDEDLLTFAVAEGRVVLTLNRRHFVLLHLAKPDHAGIVVCSVDNDSEALVKRIQTALEPFPQMEGRLVRVNRPQT